MIRYARFLAILVCAVATTIPASAATVTATTNVSIVKPVVLAKLQDLDFGTLTFSSFTGTRNVIISRAGALTCPADIVCSGAPKQARFNIQGTNKMTPQLTVTGGTLSNGTDTIPFTPDAPASIYMPNSGAPGIDFDIGGTINVSPTLLGGAYSGTLTVTADYP